MPEKKDCDHLRKALEKSLDLLGEPSKKSLLSHLSRDFDISFEVEDCSRIRDVENALESVLGAGAHIISAEMHKNLERLGSAQSRK
ncbi:MAG: hypothetical protein ACREA4_11700 [Nitrososphaera sp.]